MLLEDLRNSVYQHYHGNKQQRSTGIHLENQSSFVNGGSNNVTGSGKKPPRSPDLSLNRKSPILRNNMSGSRGNLSELDTLLQDLETKQQNSLPRSHSPGLLGSKANGPVAKSVLIREDQNRRYQDFNDYKRPEVECLLEGGRKGPAASSATRELDDLMQSLSDFKMQKHTSITTTTTTTTREYDSREEDDRGQKLDSMLGSLQADMSRCVF
jgi:hypothetical protein